MSDFINALRHSRQERLLFSAFVIALLLCGVIATQSLLQENAELGWYGHWWRQLPTPLMLLLLGLSVALAYLFYLVLRISQQAGNQLLAANQLTAIEQHIDKQLSQLLLTDSQQRRLAVGTKIDATTLEQMLANIEVAPYDGNRVVNRSNDDEHSLTLRLSMVQQFSLHVELMTGLRHQLEQLGQLGRDLTPTQRQQLQRLKQLLAAFNHDLYLDTAQEKWAKLFNAYRGLCLHLAQQR